MKNENPGYFYTEDGLRIFYTTNFEIKEFDSSKPLIVFNYGLVCSNKHWMYQIPAFEEMGYQILTHDYRFHFSSSSKEDYSHLNFKDISQDIMGLLNFIGAKKTIMLGHSMGVNVTLEFTKNYPEFVSGIVLISGTVLPPQDIMFDSNVMEIATPYIEMLNNTFPVIFKKIWASSYKNPIARKVVFRGGFNTTKVSDEFIQIYMKKIGELPPEVFLQLLSEMKAHDVIGSLEAIKCPALVMGGDKDQVIPNYVQKILHKYLPNSELYTIKDGSHVPQVDFPETINERILHFVEAIE